MSISKENINIGTLIIRKYNTAIKMNFKKLDISI